MQAQYVSNSSTAVAISLNKAKKTTVTLEEYIHNVQLEKKGMD